MAQLEDNFQKIIDGFKEELLTIRTNRPTPKLIEDLPVTYMEQPMIVKQLGSIGIEPPRDLIVNVWDEKAASAISSGINAANLGVNVSEQGKSIRITLPELTGERKEELIKIIKSMAEDARIKMRVQRDDMQKEIKEIKDEDDMYKAKEDLQSQVDEFNKQIDEAVDQKTAEIME